MWLYLVVFVLAIAALVGGVLAGGIFTIVLVPLAVIAGGSAVLYSLWGASSRQSESAETEGSSEGVRPLPHSGRGATGRVRTTPERLADARRGEQ